LFSKTNTGKKYSACHTYKKRLLLKKLHNVCYGALGLVPEARLELASCEAYASETYVYTSSTIRAKAELDDE
jgi:hypothetical protein